MERDANNRCINDGAMQNLPLKDHRSSNGFVPNVSYERLLLLIVFLLMGKKNRLGRFIHLQAVNIWKVDGIFFLLKEKNWRKKKYNDLFKRKGNSKSWKPPNSEFTVVSVRKCITASPETHCCLHFLFSQQKKKIGNVKLPHCPSSQSRERRFIFFSFKTVISLYIDKRWNSY